MHTFQSKAIREEHQEQITITDDSGNQQTVTAKIDIRYEKLDYKIKTAFNSAVASAPDFPDAMKALIKRTTEVGRQKLSEYKQRSGIGEQGDLFDQDDFPQGSRAQAA